MNFKNYAEKVIQETDKHVSKLWEKEKNSGNIYYVRHARNEYRFIQKHGIHSYDKCYIDFVKNLYENLSKEEKYKLIISCIQNRPSKCIENFIRFIDLYDKDINLGEVLLTLPCNKKYFNAIKISVNYLHLDISKESLIKLNTKYAKYVLKGETIGKL